MKTVQKLLVVALSGLFSLSALAAEFTFKMQSSDPSGDRNFQIQQQWADRVEAMSGGRLAIQLLPVGSVVKHTETLDAIRMYCSSWEVSDQAPTVLPIRPNAGSLPEKYPVAVM